MTPDAKLPAIKAGGKTLSAFFEANRGAIAAVLPRHVSPDRMLKVALGAIRQTPALLEASTTSLFGAVVACSQLGLEPNTPLGHAYLVPFKDRKKGTTEVQVIPGYRGLIDLARRSGQIVSIAAHAVRAGDEFRYSYGLDEELHHVPGDDDNAPITHFYAVAKLVGGGHAFEVMSRSKVDGIMHATQSRGAYGPWKDHYEEMGRKTLIRRLFKYLPISIELAKAVALDEAAADNRGQGLADALHGEWSVESSPHDEPEESHEPESARSLPECTAEQFEAKKPGWRKAFDGGKTVDDILTAIRTRMVLTAEQEAEIRAWGDKS